MFVNGVYLSVFYCLCYEMDVSTDMSEEQVSEERDMDLNEEEDIRIDEIRDEHQGGVAEEGENNNNMNSLRWEIYVELKEDLLKRHFSVSVPHLKGGEFFQTGVNDHIIDKKEQYEAIGLSGFDGGTREV